MMHQRNTEPFRGWLETLCGEKFSGYGASNFVKSNIGLASDENKIVDCPKCLEIMGITKDCRCSEIPALEKQNRELISTFKHIHVAKYIDKKLVDECAKCGLDLRHEIHIRG